MRTRLCIKLLTPLLALGLVLAPAVAPRYAYAHTGGPARVEVLTAGPYTFDVLLYGEPLVGRPISILLAPTDPLRQAARPTSIELSLTPDQGTEAAVRKIPLHPDIDNPTYLSADPILPARGKWLIGLSASGPEGSGTASLLVVATDPWVMPPWLGWLIWILGLAPLLGAGWLVWRVVKVRRGARNV